MISVFANIIQLQIIINWSQKCLFDLKQTDKLLNHSKNIY